MGDKLTLSQRALRPIINFAVERWFENGGFFGKRYLEPFAHFDAEKKVVTGGTAALFLVNRILKANAESAEITLTDVTHNGDQVGSWRLIVQRVYGDTP